MSQVKCLTMVGALLHRCIDKGSADNRWERTDQEARGYPPGSRGAYHEPRFEYGYTVPAGGRYGEHPYGGSKRALANASHKRKNDGKYSSGFLPSSTSSITKTTRKDFWKIPGPGFSPERSFMIGKSPPFPASCGCVEIVSSLRTSFWILEF